MTLKENQEMKEIDEKNQCGIQDFMTVEKSILMKQGRIQQLLHLPSVWTVSIKNINLKSTFTPKTSPSHVISVEGVSNIK